MTLGIEGEERKMEAQTPPLPAEVAASTISWMPVLKDNEPMFPISRTEPDMFSFSKPEKPVSMEPTIEGPSIESEQAMVFELSIDSISADIDTSITVEENMETPREEEPAKPAEINTTELFAFLNRPSSIYSSEDKSEPEAFVKPMEKREIEEQPAVQPALQFKLTEEDETSAELSISYEEGIAPIPAQAQAQRPAPKVIEDLGSGSNGDLSEEEMQKRRAQERMARLRNLSFNSQHFDHNSEFEETPAYLRRNLELHNALANVEDFYSRATVRVDENNKANISTVNTFLHGEKPD
jgi:cell division protein FtsZ